MINPIRSEFTLPSLTDKISFEDVKILIKIKMLECALKVWKHFGEELRKQGESNKRHYQVRQREIQEWNALVLSQEIAKRDESLHKKMAEDGDYIHFRHLLSPL